MNKHPLVNVLAEIAETASESLELQDVFNRVAASVRGVIPFDFIGVVRVIDGKSAVLHATNKKCEVEEEACTGPEPLESWSPRVRPRPGSIPRIDDARAELDTSFPLDAKMIEGGVRSALWAPFRPEAAFTGGVWVSSDLPHAYTDEHQAMLDPIAALLGSGVEHWRIWDRERRQRTRLDRLESLLEPVAEVLDVREVFGRISESVREILPHDLLVLADYDLKTQTFRVVALAGESDVEAPEHAVPLTEAESAGRLFETEIYADISSGLPPDTERNRLLLATGMRSWMRVPVLRSGEVTGVMGVFHREPSRYDRDDAEIARRVADRIALALSHQELAEGVRLTSEARERAERLEATVETLMRELERQGRTRVVGVSRSWKQVLRQVGRVAPSETTVLITGESGTGKEVVSRMIHQGSPRSAKPFIAINCAALPEHLLESELFGHEKGAFTGAIASKVGQVEQAAGGTLFLDEIAEMSPLVQAKFLRLLQEREFQRVGGSRVLRADVRVIAATNRDLNAAMERGAFREDLFYRLNVFGIEVPSLRSRSEDILPLAESFLDELGRTMGRPASGISRDAREWLLGHSWPGNVRELRNAIERAILLCDGGLISHEHLPTLTSRPRAVGAPAGNGSSVEQLAPLAPGGLRLDAVERSLVEKALHDAHGNKSEAARLLGLTRSQLYSRIQKFRVS